jgi:hypothetical protein
VQKVNQLPVVDDVVLQHRFDRIMVLFAAHMFMRGKIGDDTKGAFLPENLLKKRVAKIDWICFVDRRHLQTRRAAQVTG